jgi:hypothetical protein
MFSRTLCIAISFAFSITLTAQSIKKMPVAKSGCSFYGYCDISFETSFSQDSSIVYAGECNRDSISWGLICVKMVSLPASLDQAEEILTAYLNYLKTSFAIQKAAGYGKGHRLNKNEKTRGILDYWEDGEKNNWKVKGWTDGKYIAVLYAFSKKELPENKVNLFLDGFRMAE